jgi:hypothetical protein
MVNVSALIYSLSLDKTAKKRAYLKNQMLAHTLPKEAHGGGEMKKGLVSIFCLLVLTVTSLPAGAQTRYRRYDDSRRYEQRYDNYRYQDRVYSGRRNRWDRDRSFWDKHRDKLTTGIGAGAGAVLGGAVGGTKGAVIGALLGGGGAALYTYKLRDNRRRRY